MCRYEWMHGIAAVASEEWQGRRVVRGAEAVHHLEEANLSRDTDGVCHAV